MTVIRVVHNKENPFVQINKEALWNENLSLKAVGLWARCLSRPDNWRFNIKELVSKSKEGRRAIDGAINELIEHNYALRLEHWEKAPDGKFSTGGIEYVFFEFPATQEDKDMVLEEFKKSFRHCCFGDSRNGDSRNVNLLISKEEINKEREREEAEPPPPPFFIYKRVKFELSKLANLEEEFGHEKVKEMLERLDEYADINPKRFRQYANHATVIRKWIRDDQQKPTNKKALNERLAKEVREKYNGKKTSINIPAEIEVLPNSIKIGNKYIEFTDLGFQEQVKNQLIKMGLYTPSSTPR